MSLKKDIDELLHSEVITEETAVRIRQYYQDHAGSASHRLIVIFGVLGALLSGMGVILIMAYNWVELTTVTKSVVAFFPLLIAQLSGLYTLWRRREEKVWREGSGVAIVLGMGACLFLISQIFHYPGSVASLLLTWMLLILPVAYILDSGGASLLYIAGITYYTGLISYFSSPYSEAWIYWLLLLLVLPFYYSIIKRRFYSYFTTLHHWAIPLSITIVLGGFAGDQGVWMYLAYFSLFGLFFIIGNSPPFSRYQRFQNGFLMTGQVGSAIMLIMLSFKWFWKNLPSHIHPLNEILSASEFWLAAILTGTATLLLAIRLRSSKSLRKEPFAYVFLAFIACFYVGTFTVYAFIVINVIILIAGIWTIRSANKKSDFAELNFGLLIFTVLIFSRFFDSNLSFLLRGLAFILVGMGFFFVNYQLYRKKARHEK